MKKIPTIETIKRRTISNMKSLETYKVEFAPIVSRYAELVYQYNFLNREFENSNFEVQVSTGQSGVKKSPIIASLETLRKDLLTYEDRLLLNPKSFKDIENKDNQESPFAKFIQTQIGVD